MVKRYPYFLNVVKTTGETLTQKGQYVKGASEVVFHSKCRDEANSEGQSVTLEDGSAQLYNALILLPLSCPKLAKGTPVEVRDETGGLRQQGTVKRFMADQLHCRLWV